MNHPLIPPASNDAPPSRARGMAVELLFWFLPPLVFLLDYVLFWHRPAGAFEHLVFVAEVAAAFVLVRTVLLRRCRRRRARLLAAAVAGLMLYAMLAYYTLVHILLKVWARVMTTEVVETYFWQASYLCDAVGIPLPGAVVLLLLGWCLCSALAYLCLARFAWTPATARPRAASDILMLALAVFCAKAAYDFTWGSTAAAEPLRLTLWSGKTGGVRKHFSQGQAVPAHLVEAEARESENYSGARGKAAVNLVLIVVDGLRYDHLGVNGYARPTTPFLSSLAQQGRLGNFSDIHGSCGETTCALASLSASRYSHDMPPRPFTLTKALKRNGYQVRMIMGAYHPDPEALYGEVDDFVDGTMVKDIYLADDRWVLERSAALAPAGARPVMLQYHLMAAHTLGQHERAYQRFEPAARYTGKTAGAPDVRHTNYYDNGVLQADAEIRQILAGLGNKGYLRDALVVITGDHGESLGEHQLFAHTNSVNEQLLHIPLMMLRYRAGQAEARAPQAGFGSQIDIGPTILQELGLPVPATWAGAALPLRDGPAITYYQMVPYLGLYDRRAAQHRWKFYINVYNNEEFAFDLLADPQEERNLVHQLPQAQVLEWRTLLRKVDRISQAQSGTID